MCTITCWCVPRMLRSPSRRVRRTRRVDNWCALKKLMMGDVLRYNILGNIDTAQVQQSLPNPGHVVRRRGLALPLAWWQIKGGWFLFQEKGGGQRVVAPGALTQNNSKCPSTSLRFRGLHLHAARFRIRSQSWYPESSLCLIRVLVCSQHTKKGETSASSGCVTVSSKRICTFSEFRYEVVSLMDQLELFCTLLPGRRFIIQTIDHILLNVYNHIPECFVVSQSPCANFWWQRIEVERIVWPALVARLRRQWIAYACHKDSFDDEYNSESFLPLRDNVVVLPKFDPQNRTTQTVCHLNSQIFFRRGLTISDVRINFRLSDSVCSLRWVSSLSRSYPHYEVHISPSNGRSDTTHWSPHGKECRQFHLVSSTQHFGIDIKNIFGNVIIVVFDGIDVVDAVAMELCETSSS